MTHNNKGAMKYRAGAILTTSALIGASFFASASAASADPAPDAPVTTVGAAQTQTVAVPDGVCSVNYAIGGGFGSLTVSESTPAPDPDDPDIPGEETGIQGSGARIFGQIDLRGPGVAFDDWINEIDVITGSNGIGTSGGTYDGNTVGGSSGIGGHGGGGGGAYTTLTIDGKTLALAGGGGGSGGGHNPGYGAGGDAGFGASTQDAAVTGIDYDGLTGTAYPGSDGGAGWDGETGGTPNPAPQGGEAGGSTAGGAGGVHPGVADPADPIHGHPGVNDIGGNGGDDPNIDGAGGGGAGLFGGGGGSASMFSFVTGAGGGGGSSWIADDNLDGRFTADIENNREVIVDPDDGTESAGAPESSFAEFEWVMCDYSLAIEKSVVGNPVYEVGSTIRYSVTVTNEGVDPMVFGDTVTLTDDLAAGGTIVSVTGLDTSVPEAGEEIPGSGTIDLFDDVLVTPAVIDPDTQDEITPAEYKPAGLAVGDSVTVVYDVVITEAMVPAGEDQDIVNTVSTIDRANGEPISAEAAVVPAAPAMELTKTSDVQRATAAGQKITYSFVVKNTGNIDLHDVAVAEGSFSGKGTLPTPTCPAEVVEPGASITCTAVYTVLEADLTGKDLTNTATASASTPMGAEVESNVARAALVTVVPLVNTGGQAPMGIAIGAALLLALGGGLMLARRRSHAAAE